MESGPPAAGSVPSAQDPRNAQIAVDRRKMAARGGTLPGQMENRIGERAGGTMALNVNSKSLTIGAGVKAAASAAASLL